MKRNVLFLWMPKCAGVSIHESLRVLFGKRYGHYNNQYPNVVFDPSVRCATFYHSHVPALVESGFVPQSWVDDAWKFAIVRNPWDRMVSLYHYLIPYQPKKIGDFPFFIRAVVQGDYPKPERRNLQGYYQANNLLDWLRPNRPDYVGCFETLQSSWASICTQMGFPKDQFAPLNLRNTSQHTHYSEYYTPELRDLVAKHFAEEIAVFGYRFDDGRSLRCI